MSCSWPAARVRASTPRRASVDSTPSSPSRRTDRTRRQSRGAFQVACRNGHTSVANALLARGAEIDHRGYFDAPGLHWAAVNGHADTVRFLIDHGADPTIHDSHFDADALGWANDGGNGPVLEMLSNHVGRTEP